MPKQPFVLSPEERPRSLRVLDAQVTVLAAAEQTGSFEVFFDTGAEGAGPPPHSHEWDEAFYVLRGELTLVLDGEVHTAGAGSVVYLPGGTVHEFRMGPGGAELLSLTSRAGASEMFTAMDREASADEHGGAGPSER
jgi:quercetin dioxygenase-like cupin family protein